MDSSFAYSADGGTLGVETQKPGSMAPSNATLAQLLSDRRMKMLSELRDLEQALEALEKQPEFEPTMNRVMKILQRRY